MAKARATIAEWVSKAKLKHGDRYLYNLTEYTSTYDNVDIICRNHGVFSQRAMSHLRGKGCPACGNIKKSRRLKKIKGITTEQWIERAISALGDLYDYSKVRYIDSRTNVEIGCPAHGTFWTNPRQHALGHGCRKCADSNNKGIYSETYFGRFPEEKDKPGILYFLQYTNKETSEVFYKVGITARSVLERISSDKRTHDIEILMDRAMTLYDAYSKEQYILEKFSEFKCRPTDEIQGGNTECLSLNIVNEIKEI
ncbi:endonuclease [Vibrio phage D148]